MSPSSPTWLGVAASAVMVVLPYYLHNYKAFGRVTILGEFLAVAAVIMCVTVHHRGPGTPGPDLKRHEISHPGFHPLLGYDRPERLPASSTSSSAGTCWNASAIPCAPPKWIKVLSYISIPWAVSIHTVTAFLYAGLPGRGFWLTAIMAPRFLSSAFAAGPSLLILLCLLVRKYTKFDPGKEQIQSLAKVVTYAILINVFFFLCEVFTVFYSQIPDHMLHFQYLFAGLDGKGQLVPLMWFALVGMTVAGLFLVNPKLRKNESTLAAFCGLVIVTTYIDKGLGLISGGFIPNPLEQVTEYWPTVPEALITLGVWAMGFLILTVLYKVAVSIKEEIKA